MTFTAERTNTIKVSNLKKICSLLKTIKPNKSYPITEAAIFSDFKQGLDIRYTNLRQQWSVRIETDGLSLADKAYSLSQLSAFATDKETEIDFTNGNFGSYKVSEHSETDQLPQDLRTLHVVKNTISFGVKELKEALKHTAFCVSTNELNQLLCNIFVEVKEGFATFKATDGHRLSCYKVKVDVNHDFSFFIPSDSIKAVEKLCSVAIDEVLITVGSAKIDVCFETSTKFGEVSFNILQNGGGDFPNVDLLIPVQFSRSLYIKNPKQLADNLTVLSKMHKGVYITRYVEGSATSVPHYCENLKSFMIPYLPKEEKEIAFNVKYLVEFLTRVDGDFAFACNQPNSPVVYDVGNWLYLVMPVQIRD